MKLTKNKKYLQQKFSRNVLVPETAADFTPRVSKSNVPFTCKFPMVMHLVPILPRWCRSKTNFYVFSYDKACLKFCASFRFFLAVWRNTKIHYLNYVRRGIVFLLQFMIWPPRGKFNVYRYQYGYSLLSERRDSTVGKSASLVSKRFWVRAPLWARIFRFVIEARFLRLTLIYSWRNTKKIHYLNYVRRGIVFLLQFMIWPPRGKLNVYRYQYGYSLLSERRDSTVG